MFVLLSFYMPFEKNNMNWEARVKKDLFCATITSKTCIRTTFINKNRWITGIVWKLLCPLHSERFVKMQYLCPKSDESFS